MENIIKTGNGTMIMNGGNPLKGCPENWDDARAWETAQNKDKNDGYEPIWSFDCGFKLDFDGPLLSVSSRFYPPKTHYGPKWDGTVSVLFLGKTIKKQEFECPTIDELKEQVEKYVAGLCSGISL